MKLLKSKSATTTHIYMGELSPREWGKPVVSRCGEIIMDKNAKIWEKEQNSKPIRNICPKCLNSLNAELNQHYLDKHLQGQQPWKFSTS
jgi:hypothetical protein